MMWSKRSLQIEEKQFSNHFAVTEALNNVPFIFQIRMPLGNEEQMKIRMDSFESTLPKSKEMDTVDDATIYRMVEKTK